MTAFATVEGRTLAAAMKTINLVVMKGRNSIPILTMVRLTRARGEQLRLTGTDLDLEISTTVDLMDVGVEFDVCVNAATLGRIASQAGPAPVKITPSPSDPKHKDKFNPDLVLIDVADGDASYSLQSLPATDFPDFPETPEWKPLETFTNGRLATLLDKVSPCISTEEIRYYLNGVCWSADTFGRHFTTTDGHRLASCRYDQASGGEPSSIIIPRRSVTVLSKIAKGKDAAVSGAQDNMRLRFEIGSTTLLTKTIDGTFPDWRRVVPKDVPHTITFDADLLRQAVERVTMLSSERGRAVRIYQGPDGTAYIGVNNPDKGEATAKAFAEWPEVPTAKVNPDRPGYVAGFNSFGFNAVYLRQAIGRTPGKFTLRFADSGSPFIVDDGDEEMTRVLMPMRVG